MPEVIAPILIALDALTTTLWVIAVCLAIGYIVGAIAGVFRPIPVVGGPISGAMDSVGRAITTAAYGIEHGVDSLVGEAWHATANYLGKWLDEAVLHSSLFVQVAELLWRLIHGQAALRALVKSIAYVGHASLALVDQLEKKVHGIDRRVRELEREIARGIGNDVRAQIKALDQEITGIDNAIATTIPKAIEGVNTEVTQLENFIKAIPGIRYLDWASGIVVAAVGLDIFSLLKCPSMGGLFRKFGCGLGTLLNDLLGLVVAGLVLESVCEFLPVVEGAFGDVAGPIVHLLNEVPLGACEQPDKAWSKLSIAAGPLPPTQTLGPFGG